MPELNANPGLFVSRDIGGPSSTAALAFFVGLSMVWAVLLHCQVAGLSRL